MQAEQTEERQMRVAGAAQAETLQVDNQWCNAEQEIKEIKNLLLNPEVKTFEDFCKKLSKEGKTCYYYSIEIDDGKRDFDLATMFAGKFGHLLIHFTMSWDS